MERIGETGLSSHKRTVVLPLAWCFAAILALGALLYLDAPRVSLACIVGVAWLTLARNMPGVSLGLWGLATTDTIPGLNLGAMAISGRFRPLDGLIALAVVAAFLGIRDGRRSLHVPRWLWGALAAQFLWWALTLTRTCLLRGEPFWPSLLFGRDLLYMAIVAVCAIIILRSKRELRAAMIVLVLGGAVYSVGFLLQVVFRLDAGFLVHASSSALTEGLERIYTGGNDLVTALLPVALWTTLLGPRRLRWIWTSLTILFGAQVIFQLTRANYLGVGFGVLAVAALVITGRSEVGARRRKHLARTLRTASVLACCAGVVFLLLGPHFGVDLTQSQSKPVRAVTNRLTSVDQALTGADATVEYRSDLAQQMRSVLGDKWAQGIGFVHPERGEFANLPGGTLRNPDVGALGVIMVTGLVGLAVLLLPVSGTIVATARTIRAGNAVENLPIAAGLLSFLAGGLASSITLVVFFWPSSAALTGLLVGLALVAAARVRGGTQQRTVLAATARAETHADGGVVTPPQG